MTIAEALQTLELQRPVSRSSIKKAFREKSKLNHPDRAGDADLFIKIKKAYDLLNLKTEAEINHSGGEYIKPSHHRGELIISDYPFLVFLDKIISRYDHLKHKKGIGFLLKRFSGVARYLLINPQQSIGRKFIQLFSLLVFIVCIMPILLVLLFLAIVVYSFGRMLGRKK